MALQNLCLSVIVENFERYHTAFTTTQDANLKRLLEFLQRVYSFEIAEQIYYNCKIEEKYTDFLINKYLKILDTNWFSNSKWTTITTKIADIGGNIKKMHLHEILEDQPWQEIFLFLPNLEVVHFQCNCIDEVLTSIATFCPNIAEIDIRSSYNVTEEGLKSLCKKKNGKVPCQKLKKLFLGSYEVTEAAVIYLIKNLPSLEVFDCYNLPLVLYSMHKEDLTKLDKIPPYNLTKLEFLFPADICPNFTNLIKICISVCPFLTTLSCMLKQPQQLDLLLELSHLEKLHLEYVEYTDQRMCLLDINHFLKSKGSKLTSLTITNCSLSASILAESCPALKVLSMTNVKFKHHDSCSVPLFHNLDSFSVNLIDFDNETHNLKSVCLILSSSPKLESLSVHRCHFLMSELKAEILKCCEHCCLKKIDFRCSFINKPFVMDVLLTCHSLKSINLEGCGLGSDEELEIYKCAEILPNNPEICFTDQSSNSDYDDYFDDSYDNDLDDGDDYDEYGDYFHDYEDYDDDDDDDDVYGFFI